MSDTVEQSDVEEITNMVEIITERADQIKTKAFTLRQIQKPEPEGKSAKIAEAGDFASDIKSRLTRIQKLLNEADESLARFAG